jgi:glycosyltransferase involved in cell wall biosynthesis
LRDSRIRQVDELTVEHVPYLFPPGMLRGAYGKFYRWSVKRAFARHVATFRPEIVFTHWAYPDGWAAVKLGHAHRLPVVIQVLGSDVLLLKETPSRRPGTIEALSEADGVWAVSADLAREVVELGASPDRVRLIYDGVDTSLFFPGSPAAARERLQLDHDRQLILFVGNLVKVKAIDKLLDASEQLHQQGISFHLAILGEGNLRQNLEEQAAQLHCKDAIRFYGSQPQESLPDWFRAADVLVLPSYSEGVPNVLLEASACNTPYVATRVGGVPEIEHRGHGLLVPPGDVAALATAIRVQLERPRPAPVPARSREECIKEFVQFLRETVVSYHEITPHR